MALKEGSQHGDVSLLYSNEILPELLADTKKTEMLVNTARINGFNEIRILYLLREPISFAVSAWHQQVKYIGMTIWLDECIKQPNYVKRKFSNDLSVLENLSSDDIFKPTVLNYNRCSSKLLEIIAEWTNIDTSGFVIPEAARINRSLSHGELRLQIAMNKILGAKANFISRSLTETLTDVNSETITPSIESQKILWERISPFVDKINKYLPYDHHIKFDTMEFKQVNETVEYSTEQIDFIGQTVADRIKHLENELAIHLSSNDPCNKHKEQIKKNIFKKKLQKLLK
jgi:hypothetical protein